MDCKMSKYLKGYNTCLVYISLVRHKAGVCLHFLGQSPEHVGLLAPCVSACRDQFAGYSSTQGIISVFSKNRFKIGSLWFTSQLCSLSTPKRICRAMVFHIVQETEAGRMAFIQD